MGEQATQAHETCAEAQETTEEHKRFEPFAGTFTAKVKMWMGPGEPVESTGTMINTIELGGRFLRHHYRGDDSGGAFPGFEGHGFWGFNTFTKKYEGVWIDTVSTMMQTDRGEVDASGKVWTMRGQIPGPEGGFVTKRSVIRLVNRDHHSMEMYIDRPDGTQTKAMEIEYLRKT